MKPARVSFRKGHPVRIIVVDDHPMVRERLAEVINQEADLKVCGEAEDAGQALQLVATAHPDVAIVDSSLRQSRGIDLIKDLAVQYPKLLMLVVSMHDESLYAERVLRAGAHGYINKQEATKNVVPAIRQILTGKPYVSESFAQTLAARVLGRSTVTSTGDVSVLADRELQVFQMIGRGHTRRQIAEALHVDVSTVETYRDRIKEKLNLRDANEVLQRAIAWQQRGPVA